MEKVLFALEVEDGWPPVATEGVWCERVNGNYKLKNVPFFISGLAMDDTFTAEPDAVNEHIFEYEILKESGRSVVWLMNNKRLDISEFIKKIKALGCRYESLTQYSLGAIDVPPSIDVTQFYQAIDEYEAKGLDFAFPVWRLE